MDWNKRQADELGNLLAVVSISTANATKPAKAAQHAPSNSTSTIFATNAISHPNFSEIVQAVAFVVSASLECADQNAAVAPVDDLVACFDERTYDSTLAGKPVAPVTVLAVSAFIGAAITRGKFSCEVLIIALVLFNRLIIFPEQKVIPHARSWRLMFITAIMVAQKLFDDVAVDNVDFPIVWKAATKTSPGVRPSVKAFGQMEAKMMQLLKFSVYISPSLYAQYYYELKTVYDEHFKAEFPVPPLSLEGAKHLEIRTGVSPDVLHCTMAPSSKSDCVAVKSQARAVLS